jgi:N-acetylmuramoyl-L-alanine amidase
LFTLENPHRIVVDVPNREVSAALASARRPPAAAGNSVARQLNLGVHRIVIDPGHGGSDPGAIGRTGLMEKNIALDISRRLAAKLRANDAFEVLLTRDDDRTLELEERTAYANLVEADLFVSIHINSSNNRKLSGFETYFLDLPLDPSAAETAARENAGAESRIGDLDEMLTKIVQNDFQRESRDLAQAIQDSLVLQLNKSYRTVRDLGVKQAPFVVLIGSQMPSVLVEIAFLSNGDEEELLGESGFREKVSEAVYVGIKSYIERRQVPVYAE